MIYVAIIAFLLFLAGFYLRLRASGFRTAILDLLVSAAVGWIAGILIGIGARIGMWAIPFFNGTDSRFTPEGSLQVVLVFSLYGIGLGILYEFFFRRLVRERGWVYGLFVTAVLTYPLASAAFQQLTFTPALAPSILVSVLFVGMMFVPFTIVLEYFVGRWHRRRCSELPSPRTVSIS